MGRNGKKAKKVMSHSHREMAFQGVSGKVLKFVTQVRLKIVNYYKWLDMDFKLIAK